MSQDRKIDARAQSDVVKAKRDFQKLEKDTQELKGRHVYMKMKKKRDVLAFAKRALGKE